HPPGQQALPDRVVDLVRAGVVEVLALEVDGVAGRLRQPAGRVQRRRAADVVAQEPVELRAEAGIVPGLQPRRLELGQRGHERLGHVLAAVGAEAVLDCAYRTRFFMRLMLRSSPASPPAPLTAAKNASSLSGSLTPGDASVPEAT